MVKSRVVHLLQFLLQQKESVTTYQLASNFNVNIRSVQQDLVDLDDWIETMKWNVSLSRITGSKVMLQVKEEEKEDILQFIHSQNPLLKVYGPEERRQLILLELFKRDESMIVKELEIDFRVSESTILRDLKQLQAWVEQRGLILIRRQNYGIQLVGSELNWRNAAFDLIKGYLQAVNRIRLEDLFVQLQCDKLTPHYIRYAHLNVIHWLLPEEDFYSLERLSRHTMQLENCQLTDEAVASLLIHVAIAIHRVGKGKIITVERDQLRYIQQSPAYATIQRFLAILQQYVGHIHFPDEEIAYMAMHLAGSRFVHPIYQYSDAAHTNLMNIVDHLVKTLEGFTQLELRNDQQFISGLYAHLGPMLQRLKFGIPIHNELLKEVQHNYPDIYTATKLAVLLVENHLPSSVPDDEIGYLAMHVGAVIERKKPPKKKQRKRVALVCSSGIGTSNLILIQLTREFPEIDIVGSKHAFEVQALKTADVDLIISTVDITHPSIPVIHIHPILSTQDFEKLRLALKKRATSSVFWEEVIDHIVLEARKNGLVNTSIFRENIRDLIYERLFTARVDHKQSLGEDERPVLQDLLNEQTVKITNQCTRWEEAVKDAGKILWKAGTVERSYVDAMVQAIKEHGPYVVIAPGIALVHARPEDGVKEVCMSLLVCPKGVPFGNEEKDPVQLIFAFGAVDDNEHLRALSQMMTLLNDAQAIKQLKAAVTVKEALSVLHKSVKTS